MKRLILSSLVVVLALFLSWYGGMDFLKRGFFQAYLVFIFLLIGWMVYAILGDDK